MLPQKQPMATYSKFFHISVSSFDEASIKSPSLYCLIPCAYVPLISLPGTLFIGGKFGERAGGESSSELATVLMAS